MKQIRSLSEVNIHTTTDVREQTLFERPHSGERAVLVHVEFADDRAHEEFEELQELVRSAGAEPVACLTSHRVTPDPGLFVGRGKAEEVRASVCAFEAEVVIVNHELSPAQERNLERFLECRVVDRIGLILDIFAQRAHSFEGKLQVELAQLSRLASRLVRGWTHLERQKGGIGLRGPGEKQLESDRRLIGERIKQIHHRLGKVSRGRELSRRARRRANIPVVSLVGYTNAGKSTLFNRLTGAGALTADRLFATLDPKLRRLSLSGGRDVILADTVGFIRHLPHDLVAAFRATLEETLNASLLLHVIDSSSEGRAMKAEQVNEVLREIGADQIPQIEVYNKLDRLHIGDGPCAERDGRGRIKRVWLSASTGQNMSLLLEALAQHVTEQVVHRQLCLPPTAGRLRARLYELGTVVNEQAGDNGEWLLEVELSPVSLERLCRREGLDRSYIAP